jgi:hypothetical protein
MTDKNIKHTKEYSKKGMAHGTSEYDPFVRGRFPVGVRTIQGLDRVRDRLFPCEIWYPAAAQRLSVGDIEAELAGRGVDVIAHKP